MKSWFGENSRLNEMISLKKLLETTQCTHGNMAPGELAWSHAPNLAIHKKWEQWRVAAMEQFNLPGWTKLADLVDDNDIHLDSDKKGLTMAGQPANDPIYGLEIIENENDGYVYQMDKWVHNKKRVFK